MTRISFTLVSEGSSDKALLNPITWLLRRKVQDGTVVRGEWADFSFVREKPRTLIEKISVGVELFPCDILFIHRDCDASSVLHRQQEIDGAVVAAFHKSQPPLYVHVIPIRMHEAWLLFDEAAIRRASGNPQGRVNLNLPRLRSVENVADPKGILHAQIRTASQARGRRLHRLNLGHCVYLVSSFITDFSPLLTVGAFAMLDRDIDQVLANL